MRLPKDFSSADFGGAAGWRSAVVQTAWAGSEWGADGGGVARSLAVLGWGIAAAGRAVAVGGAAAAGSTARIDYVLVRLLRLRLRHIC